MGFSYTNIHTHDELSNIINEPNQYFSFITNQLEEEEYVKWQTHISHRYLS